MRTLVAYLRGRQHSSISIETLNILGGFFYLFLSFFFFFKVLPKPTGTLQRTQPGDWAPALLLATSSRGKSEPTKAGVGIVGDIIALGAARVCGWEGKAPRHEAAQRLKTREASVKQ